MRTPLEPPGLDEENVDFEARLQEWRDRSLGGPRWWQVFATAFVVLVVYTLFR